MSVHIAAGGPLRLVAGTRPVIMALLMVIAEMANVHHVMFPIPANAKRRISFSVRT